MGSGLGGEWDWRQQHMPYPNPYLQALHSYMGCSNLTYPFTQRLSPAYTGCNVGHCDHSKLICMNRRGGDKKC